MYEIQVLDDQGQWRDDLVSDYTEDNRFATVADAETAMKDLLAATSDIETLLGWRVEEVMETYLIAEVLGTGDWGIIEEFGAEDDKAANAYAEEHYSHIEWYVLYQSTHVNIND
jgi:glycine cleavage system aminomethyltransferase T